MGAPMGYRHGAHTVFEIPPSMAGGSHVSVHRPQRWSRTGTTKKAHDLEIVLDRICQQYAGRPATAGNSAYSDDSRVRQHACAARGASRPS